MESIGESDEGVYLGERTHINKWFGLFFMILLFYAGGCRPCTVAVCKSITRDGTALLLSGPEKTRRIQRTLYSPQGDLMQRLEPYLNFFGDVKVLVKFHFEQVRRWAIENLKARAEQDHFGGNWGDKLQTLMKNLPTQALFNTSTGEDLTAGQMTRNVRHYAREAKLFDKDDIEVRETRVAGGRRVEYYRVSPHIRKQLSCRGMRRAIATAIAMDFNEGRIGNKPGGGRMSDEEFLCALATVFNTSVSVLCNHYIQCRIGTWETDFSAWACIYRDASNNIIPKSNEAFKVKEASWDCPKMDRDYHGDGRDGSQYDGEEGDEEGSMWRSSDSSEGEDEIDEWLYGEDNFAPVVMEDTKGSKRSVLDSDISSISPLKKRKRKKKRKMQPDDRSNTPQSIGTAPSTPVHLNKKRTRNDEEKRTIMTRRSQRRHTLSSQ